MTFDFDDNTGEIVYQAPGTSVRINVGEADVARLAEITDQARDYYE